LLIAIYRLLTYTPVVVCSALTGLRWRGILERLWSVLYVVFVVFNDSLLRATLN